MSTAKPTIVENEEFIGRFIEVCGTSKPTEIAQLFNISYQAAKNYLEGRLPDTSILINIGKTTPYSIHWLLTGLGPKIAQSEKGKEALSDDVKILIKQECERIVPEIVGEKVTTTKGKVIVLNKKDIKEEKVINENNPVSLNRR